jgi:hypothetical protein
MCTFTFCGNYRATATERNSLVEHDSEDYIRQFVAMPLGEGFTGKLIAWVARLPRLLATVVRTYLIIPRGRDRGDFGSWRDAVSVV